MTRPTTKRRLTNAVASTSYQPHASKSTTPTSTLKEGREERPVEPRLTFTPLSPTSLGRDLPRLPPPVGPDARSTSLPPDSSSFYPFRDRYHYNDSRLLEFINKTEVEGYDALMNHVTQRLLEIFPQALAGSTSRPPPSPLVAYPRAPSPSLRKASASSIRTRSVSQKLRKAELIEQQLKDRREREGVWAQQSFVPSRAPSEIGDTVGTPNSVISTATGDGKGKRKATEADDEVASPPPNDTFIRLPNNKRRRLSSASTDVNNHRSPRSSNGTSLLPNPISITEELKFFLKQIVAHLQSRIKFADDRFVENRIVRKNQRDLAPWTTTFLPKTEEEFRKDFAQRSGYPIHIPTPPKTPNFEKEFSKKHPSIHYRLRQQHQRQASRSQSQPAGIPDTLPPPRTEGKGKAKPDEKSRVEPTAPRVGEKSKPNLVLAVLFTLSYLDRLELHLSQSHERLEITDLLELKKLWVTMFFISSHYLMSDLAMEFITFNSYSNLFLPLTREEIRSIQIKVMSLLDWNAAVPQNDLVTIIERVSRPRTWSSAASLPSSSPYAADPFQFRTRTMSAPPDPLASAFGTFLNDASKSPSLRLSQPTSSRIQAPTVSVPASTTTSVKQGTMAAPAPARKKPSRASSSASATSTSYIPFPSTESDSTPSSSGGHHHHQTSMAPPSITVATRATVKRRRGEESQTESSDQSSPAGRTGLRKKPKIVYSK